ncbi:hypothetical protein MJO29_003019, partial [Puccinia striiformis f. sp. tritici]
RPKWFQPNQTHNPAREKLSNQRGTSNQSARGWSSRVRGGGRNGGSRGSNQPQSRINSNKEDQETNTSTNNPNLPYSGLTLENYERLLPPWTKKQLRQVLGRQKGGLNQIPLEVKEALQLHRMNYTKIKFMLALIGTVSAKPVNSWLYVITSLWHNEIVFARSHCCCLAGKMVHPERKVTGTNMLHIVKRVQTHRFPLRGAPMGGMNKMVTWAPPGNHYQKKPQWCLTQKYLEIFRRFPLHMMVKMIGTTKTKTVTMRASYSMEIQLSNSSAKKKKKNILRQTKFKKREANLNYINLFASQLFTLSTAYYLLASTQYPGPGSFCKELSNNATWLEVAHEKWTAKATFEAYSQGQTIQAIVDGCSGVGRQSKIRKVADKIRSNLRESLNQLLGMLFMSLIASHSTIDHSSFIGQAGELLRVESLNFPKGSDPEASLLGGYPCLMIV